MKFTFVAITVVFSAFCTVYSVFAAAPAIHIDPESDLFNKAPSPNVFITCNNENDAYECLLRIRSIPRVEPPSKDYYDNITLDLKDTTKIEAIFDGECTKANEILRKLPDCGLQQCAEFSCTK